VIDTERGVQESCRDLLGSVPPHVSEIVAKPKLNDSNELKLHLRRN